MEPPAEEWYTIHNVQEIDSPSLVVYPDRVHMNIRMAKSMSGDPQKLRPHVKTHKSPDVVRMQQAEGITKFKCATVAEAEMLALSGAPDVLFAYQPVGPKVVRLRALTRKYTRTRFSCLVDDPGAAAAIAEAFAGEPEPLRVLVDLDVGMHRTGITPGEPALSLFRTCDSLKGIRPVGLHAYDGHIEDKDPANRRKRCDDAFAAVEQMTGELQRTVNSAPLVVAGGSPTFPIHAGRHGVECSPGTFVYWDKSYLDSLPEQTFLPSALIISRVISRPAGDLLCLDLGHKSVAAEKELGRRIWFLNLDAWTAVSQSEEHLVVRIQNGRDYPIGTVFFGIPYHICPTCALYERAVTVRSFRADGEWPTLARNRVVTE